MVSGSRQVSCDGELHDASSLLPSHLSSLPLPHTSGLSELTVGSLSSQSWPPAQCASGSPSPSASRGAWTQVCVGSSQRSIVQVFLSSHPIGSPARQPSLLSQRSTPSQ